MDILVLGKLLQEKGWDTGQRRREHQLLEPTLKPQTTSFILPVYSSEKVPAGTLNAILRLAYAGKETYPWTSFIDEANNVNVILEKQGDGLWGRIEIPGLLIATRGCTADCVSNTLRSLLIEFALIDEALDSCAAIAALPFVPVYDTTAVWTLIKQLKATYIAEQVGIDMELVGQYMSGNTYPCPDVAKRLEESIHEFGRQLIQLSIR